MNGGNDNALEGYSRTIMSIKHHLGTWTRDRLKREFSYPYSNLYFDELSLLHTESCFCFHCLVIVLLKIRVLSIEEPVRKIQASIDSH